MRRNLQTKSNAETSLVRELLADAATHYRATLRESPRAVSYLRGRGIGGAIAARYGIGFAAPGWHGLDPILARHDLTVIEASGLQVFKDGPQPRRFDRFRDRVMFPIRDHEGEIVGFGGRVLAESDGQPKYMNSPEGPCFRKRSLLYGLYEARDAIQAEGVAVVVEGYLDVVSLAQAGFSAAVGTLGTACTADQVALLAGLAPRLVFAFDGDAAGRRAAVAALAAVLPHVSDTLTVDFLFLPAEHDPDSYIRAHGLDSFHAALANPASLGELVRQHVSEGCNFSVAEGRSKCTARAQPIWLAMPDGRYRDDLLEYCCTVSGLTLDELRGFWLQGQG